MFFYVTHVFGLGKNWYLYSVSPEQKLGKVNEDEKYWVAHSCSVSGMYS